MQRELQFLTIAAVIRLAGIEIPRYCGWVSDFMQVLSSDALVVETVLVHCELWLLGCCQWIRQWQLILGNVEVMVVVRAIVLLVILQSWR